MPKNNAVTELYNKMLAEQEQYKNWLVQQSPQEILNHAEEYSTKQNILFVVESSDLTEIQAKALLTSPTPLEDIWSIFDKSEAMMDDNIRDCMSSRAAAILMQTDFPKDVPVYMQSASFAIENKEFDVFRVSHQINMDCCDVIEAAINNHYHNNVLDVSCAAEIVDKYGLERVWAVMANTIQQMDLDGRISSVNKTWAKGFVLPEDDRREYRITQCHPGLIDLFCTEVRRIQKEIQQEKDKKPSVLEKLTSQPARTSPQVAPKARNMER